MNETPPLQVFQIAPGDLWAGAEVQLYNLARGLDQLPNIEVCVILLNHDALARQLIKAGIEVIIIDENTHNSYKILRKLIQLISKRQPDIIHTHRSKINILGSIAAFISGRIPSLKTAHGSQEHPPSWKQVTKRLILFTEWFCSRFIQKKIIAVSEDLALILEKDYPTNRISVIENGINSTHLLENLQPTTKLSANDIKSFRIGIAGRLVPIKRIDLFIQTAYYFKQHYKDLDVSFHIIGDGPLRKELEALNAKLQTDNIVYFEGHCDNMPQKLKTLDALLMTSDNEGLPMVLLEAMTLKTPIIAHAIGGIPRLLNQGKCGQLVEDHSGASYAHTLYELLRNPTKKNDATQKAFNRVTTIYSAEKNALAHLALYKSICSPKPNHKK